MAYSSPGETLQLTCLASDGNNDPLTYTWTATGGFFKGTGNAIDWIAPATEGIFELTVKVSDDEGLFAQKTIKILVKSFNTIPGDLITHYPFTGNANDASGNQLHGQDLDRKDPHHDFSVFDGLNVACATGVQFQRCDGCS